MQEQLDRIEEKLDRLTVAVEHRLTALETTQRGIKWFVCLVVSLGVAGVTIIVF